MNRSYSQGNLLSPSTLMEKKKVNRSKHRKLHRLRIIRPIRLIYYRLIRLRANPQTIARGLALGVFAGFFPLFGLQTAIGIFLAAIFRGSKLAAVAGTWVSNPLTYVPIYVFNYHVGKLILRTEDTIVSPLNIESFKSFRQLGFSFGATLITGCVVVGAIAAFVVYFGGLPVLKRLRRRRKSNLSS